jgi:hypothetical protein
MGIQVRYDEGLLWSDCMSIFDTTCIDIPTAKSKQHLVSITEYDPEKCELNKSLISYMVHESAVC